MQISFIMSESAKTEESCGECKMDAPWYPLKKWWQFSQICGPDIGLPPVLEPGDPRWTSADWFKRSPAACSWLGFVPAPLFVPYISESMHHTGQMIRKWRISMDVSHFYPSEISLGIRGGFLEVRGNHEERPDELGFITRCFSRKYRLPAEVDINKLVSALSVDGILTVEAPVPETSASAAIIVPIKVETEDGEQEVKIEDKEEDSQPEVHDAQDQPSSTTAHLEQEDEETQEKSAEETHPPHPPAPAEDENLQSLQQSSDQHKTLESLEDPGASAQLEQKEPTTDDGEIQVKEEGGEALTQPEEQELDTSPSSDVQSQELQAMDRKQEATKE